MELREFLVTVVTGGEGYFSLSHSSDTGSSWTEEWYEYPLAIDRIVDRVQALTSRNVYFSPYLFRERKSTKDSCIVGRTIAADLDGANVLTLRYKPTVIVESSQGRHQGYWILDEALSSKDHEHSSKQLTYSIAGCDRSGWWIAHKFRVPGSKNYKWERTSEVKVVTYTGRLLKLSELKSLPEVPSKNGVDYDISDDFIARALRVSTGPQEYLSQVAPKLPPKVVSQYNYEAQDRSAALWALTMSAFRAGLSTEQVFFLARGSANNKFSSLRFNGDRELLKDVIRARTETYSGGNSLALKDKIDSIRKFKAEGHEKLAFMAKTVIETMKERGQFINCEDGTAWFIDNEVGRPIPIVTRAESLQVYMDHTYGINSTERESSYIISALISHVSGLPAIGRLGSMSYYDTDSNTVLLHTGKKKVLHISSKEVQIVPNGYDGIVFPWMSDQEVIDPYFKHDKDKWDDILFGGCFDNIVGMKKEQAQALLKVWLLMVLLRRAIVSRPILAVFGQPGAGKSTLFRRIYTFLYGKTRSLSGITTSDNFDFATAADPLVVFDNVDTWERWMPDRLALAAAVSEVKKRKLYTNSETVTLTRQAIIGLTAHNPKFGREDINDRLVVITLERLKEFKSETELLDYIHRNRSELWGSIIEDIQKVLATNLPDGGVPQFRIEDFAKFGGRIAAAVGCQKEFYSALIAVAEEQKAINIEGDQPLVEALSRFLESKKFKEELRTPGQWWGILTSMARDPLDFERTYKNAVILGKKFWTMQDSLKTMFIVDWEYDKRRGSRLWNFKPKGEVVNGTAKN